MERPATADTVRSGGDEGANTSGAMGGRALMGQKLDQADPTPERPGPGP